MLSASGNRRARVSAAEGGGSTRQARPDGMGTSAVARARLTSTSAARGELSWWQLPAPALVGRRWLGPPRVAAARLVAYLVALRWLVRSWRHKRILNKPPNIAL
jgi:hypothetical protein